jgi:hypothetical protein
MAIKTVDLRLPSYWSTFLFYGDPEGLDIGEIEQILEVLQKSGVDRVSPFEVTHYGFTKFHDASNVGVLPADCSTYTFPVV